jgi:hypothetical protein
LEERGRLAAGVFLKKAFSKQKQIQGQGQDQPVLALSFSA